MIGLRGIEDGLGGVEKAVREISSRLVEKGVDVTCYCRPRYNQETEFKGVKLVNTPTLYSKHLETAFYSIISMIKAVSEDYDIIHIHALATSTLAWIPYWFSNKKIVVTIHGLDWQRNKWNFMAKKILQFGEACSVKYANCIICVSQNLQTYFEMRYLKDNFVYIPNGCDLMDSSHEPPVIDGFESKNFLLYLGRIEPEKNLHTLIDAYEKIATKMPLVIAGPMGKSKDYNKQIEEMAKKDPRIILTGVVKGDKKDSLLHHAYLFILPSKIEGLPIAALEAASQKTCLALSNIPTSLEVIGDKTLSRGYIFNPNVEDELRLMLQISLENPELTAILAAEGSKYVETNFNWDKIAQSTFDAYNKALKS